MFDYVSNRDKTLIAISFVIFIIAQGIGIGIIASGEMYGFILMLLSAGSGFYAVRYSLELL